MKSHLKSHRFDNIEDAKDLMQSLTKQGLEYKTINDGTYTHIIWSEIVFTSQVPLQALTDNMSKPVIFKLPESNGIVEISCNTNRIDIDHREQEGGDSLDALCIHLL